MRYQNLKFDPRTIETAIKDAYELPCEREGLLEVVLRFAGEPIVSFVYDSILGD